MAYEDFEYYIKEYYSDYNRYMEFAKSANHNYILNFPEFCNLRQQADDSNSIIEVIQELQESIISVVEDLKKNKS